MISLPACISGCVLSFCKVRRAVAEGVEANAEVCREAVTKLHNVVNTHIDIQEALLLGIQHPQGQVFPCLIP